MQGNGESDCDCESPPLDRGTVSMRKSSGARALALLLVTAIGGFGAGDVTAQGALDVFGPRAYHRFAGKPFTETDTFHVADPSGGFTLNVYNGGGGPGQPSGHRVSSAWLYVNGVAVLRPGDFDQNVERITRSVVLEGTNTLSVKLRSRPGSLIVVEILGTGTPANAPPVADAGPDQTVSVGSVVTLDGSASSDADGDPLTFDWALLESPPGSAPSLSDPSAVMPAFVADVPGAFLVELVVDDGTAESDPATVVVTTVNSAPVADAGPDRTVPFGETVALDGSASSDVDGDLLSYAWSVVDLPPGSTAVLSDAGAVTPTFVADVAGSYAFSLLVSDGFATSAADTVIVTTANSPPVADAGPDRSAFVGDVVVLDGSGSSDVDGDLLDFDWSLLARPDGSLATLFAPGAVMPELPVDAPGTYVVQLVVNDGSADSAPDSLTVSTLNSPPVADAGDDQSAFVGDTVTLDGSGSTDVDGDLLSHFWALVSRPAASSAMVSDPVAVSPSFVVDAPGVYVAELIVSDGIVASAPDTSTVTTLNSPPVARAGDDQAVRVGDTVTLDGGMSSDADGDALSFDWSLSAVPPGSGAALDDPVAVAPRFVVDSFGTYVAQLVVSDGTVASAPDSVVVDTLNTAPVADAGADQEVEVGAVVQLDGSGSSDADGDPLDYFWSLVATPRDSAAVLSGATVESPTFIADRPGTYVGQLIVGDGIVDSAPDTVRIDTANRAPLASIAAPARVQAGDVVDLDGTLSVDPDGDALSHAWTLHPAPRSTATLSSATTASAQFVAEARGRYRVTLVVSDGELDSDAAVAEVEANGAPRIVSAPVTTGVKGEPWSYAVRAIDPEADPLAFALTQAPAGMTVDAGGLVEWTLSGPGTYAVTVEVSDARGGSARQSFTLRVENRPPAITSLPRNGALVNVRYAYPVVATDPDGDAVVLTLVEAPAGMSLDPSAGEIGWTPDASGTVAVEIRATDALGASAVQRWQVRVVDPGEGPRILGQPLTGVPENGSYLYPIQAADPNPGDALAFELVTGPTGMTLGVATGELRWQPGPGRIASSGATDLACADGLGQPLADLRVASLSWADADAASGALSAVIVNRGAADAGADFEVSFHAGEPAAGGTSLGTVTVSGPAQGGSVVATLAGVPAAALSGDVHAVANEARTVSECTAVNNAARAPVVVVAVLDPAAQRDQQRFLINVTPVNDLPVITSAAPVTTASAAQPFEYEVAAVDPDAGDRLRFGLAAGPAGMQVGAASGRIAWQPAPDQGGSHPVTVTVTDLEGGVDTQDLVVSVSPSPLAPAIVTAAVTRASAEYTYDVDAVDPNPGDTVSYALATAPAGMSVDAATGVIEWTPDPSLASGIAAGNPFCAGPPADVDALAPVLQWSWTGSPNASSHDQVMTTPVVVRLEDGNGDGAVDAADPPAVVFMSFAGSTFTSNGVLRAVRGTDGSEIWSVTGSGDRVAPIGNVAAGDVDGDGLVEIAAPASSGGVILFEHDGAVKWRTTRGGLARWGAIAIADLDGDGTPEIVAGTTVLDADGEVLWTASGPFQGSVPGQPASAASVADLDGDGTREVIIGASAWTADGTLAWLNTGAGEGYTGVADLDGDAQPEVVLVGEESVRLLDRLGQVIWGPVALPGGGFGGPPTIGDMDGDGTSEIGVAGASAYTVFRADGSVAWTVPTRDASAVTASASFDFNGDGRVEVVYADEVAIRVYDGRDGAVLFQESNGNATWLDYPVVADVDNDGSAELIVVANDVRSGLVNGVRVFRGAGDDWAPTRSIWNQHAYHVDNVLDDGSIPASPERSERTRGTWRLNTFADRAPLARADLQLDALTLVEDERGTALVVTVRNRGAAAYPAGARVEFSGGDPHAGAPLLGSVTLAALGVGEERSLRLDGVQPGALVGNPHARLVVADEALECELRNNATASALVTVRATDSTGLSDLQRFAVSVEAINEAPAAVGTPLTAGTVGLEYVFAIEAEDPDVGDALRYALVAGPQGMMVDARTGLVRWTPAAGDEGTHPVTVRITDLTGALVEQSFDVEVAAGSNLPPAFTSVPVTQAVAGTDYRYDAVAEDPDAGEVLRFALDRGPDGMRVDPISGRVSWPPSPDYAGGIAGANPHCIGPGPDPSLFAPVQKWARGARVEVPAMVAQMSDDNGDGRIDADDVPDLVYTVFVNSSTGRLTVVSGDSGAELLRIDDPAHVVSHIATPAMADLDGDGFNEIVAPRRDGGVVVYGHDGVLRWFDTTNPNGLRNRGSTPSVADIDGDGSPEVILGTTVFNADGTLRWTGTGAFSGQTPVETENFYQGFAVDVDGDPGLEVVAGASVHDTDGTLLWQNDAVGDGKTAIGNFDGDDRPEIVVHNAAGLHLVDDDGSTLWGPVPLPGGGRGAAPVVGDLDGDGLPEVGVAGATGYVVFESDGSIAWTAPTRDGSAVTGSTVFDFDDDGRAEIVYADETRLRVYDGATGTVLFETGHRSFTSVEYPTVADVDGDGHAEIVVTGSDAVRVLEDAADSWVDTRRIWNQYDYHVDNVDAHGSVPVSPARSWLTHGTFRANRFAGRRALARADLHLDTLRLEEDAGGTDTLRVTLRNRGTAPVTVPATVQLFSGDPAAGGVFLGEVEISELAAGVHEEVVLSGIASGAVNADPVARVSAAVTECTAANNETRSAYVRLRVTDSTGLVASQRFAVAVDGDNTPPRIVSDPVTSVVFTLVDTWLYAVQAADDDVGDGLRHELVQAPAGMHIDESTGLVRWRVSAADEGAHAVVVRVTDLRGATDEQGFTLHVLPAPNAPPVIESAPVTAAMIGTAYVYDVVATDAGGETLAYVLAQAPGGMAIDAGTGRIAWTPGSAQAGDHPVTVRVADPVGQIARQSFTVTVAAAPNDPPAFSRAAPPSASVGQLWSYLAAVTDPDGDPLSFSLDAAPGGMTVTAGGRVEWTPQPGDEGTAPVALRVSDGRGGAAVQTFALAVSAVGQGNRTPEIVSVPSTQAVAAVAYRYDVAAGDPDGDALVYALDAAPGGMSVDGAGVVSWLPGEADAGLHAVVVRVSDGRGATAVQAFDLEVVVAGDDRAPVVNGLPAPAGAKVGREYRFDLQAADADGDPLTFSLITAPTGMQVDGAGVVSWTPAAGQEGTHPVVVRISDGLLYEQVSMTVTVVPAGNALTLAVSFDPPLADQGESVVIRFVAGNAAGAVRFTATVNDDPIPVVAGEAVFSATGQRGEYRVSASASDGVETAIAEAAFRVRDPSDVDPPVISLAAPGDGARITAPVDVIASASDASPLTWRALLRPRSAGVDTVVASGSGPLADAPVYRFDPTLRLNGLYRLVFEATDANGQVAREQAVVRADGDMKVGNFSFTVVDLEVPLSGIPVRVTRTYDTRRKEEALDWGYGWSVNYQDVKVEESRVPGAGWALGSTQSGPFGVVSTWCVRAHGENRVAVTLPDGRVESFRVKAEPECSSYVPVIDVQLALEPEEGALSTLEWVGAQPLRLVGDRLEVLGEGEPVDPSRYRLTTKEGFVYELDQGFGIRTITDRNGNVITYSDGGITHSDGRGVVFERDGQGRIEALVDPEGNRFEYAFDAAGDLVGVTDPERHTTSYVYDARHALVDLVDPLGRRPVRNLYDDDGRLVAQEDADGNRTGFDHDVDARVSVTTDRLGRVTQLFYDEEGNVARRVDALGEETRFTFDARGNQLTETDPLGHVVRATYDAQDNVRTQSDGEGHTVAFTYNALGQELTLTDARGNRFENTYDAFGNVLSVKDPIGNVTIQNIDAKGRVSLTRDALGNTTVFAYDEAGNRVRKEDATGAVTTATYDDNGNRLSETRTRTVDGVPVEETTVFEYDALNRLVATTDALGHVTRIEYDALGNESARIDARGQRTRFEYDAHRRLARTTFPDGTTEVNAYDAEGNLVATTDRLGRVTRFEYDALDRQVRTIVPDDTPGDDSDNPFTETGYDAAGRVVAEVDANGHRTAYEYDRANRRTRTVDALGHSTVLTYDEDDNLVAQTDARGNTVRFEYDALDRRIATVYPDGAVEEQGFDAAGRNTSTTDQNGRVTRFEYDGVGRLTKVIDALGQETAFGYDEAGNKVAQSDANGHVTRWTHDALGRRLSRTLPLGQTERMTYDPNGNLATTTDFEGLDITFEHDVIGRPVRKTYADGREEVTTWDAVGNRLTVSDTRGVTTWRYDARDRMLTKTDPDGTVLAYAYDAAGNQTRRGVTLPGGPERAQRHSYDALDRLETVTDPDGGLYTHAYDAVGNRSRDTYPNGTVTRYGHDQNNRLRVLETLDGTGAPMQRFDYDLGPTGRRLGVSELDGRTVRYAYDALYRLTEERITPAGGGADAVNAYHYDPVGNRVFSVEDGVSTAYGYDDNDRLLTAGELRYGYDANGNQTSVTEDDTVVTYGYDQHQRLVAAETTIAGAPTTTVAYQYDVDGNRVGKEVDGVSTRFVVDANRELANVVVEKDAAGDVVVEYLHGDDLYRQVRGGQGSYYHYDGLGSTVALSDFSGAQSDMYRYDAWGDDFASKGMTPNEFLFAGERLDVSTHDYYLRARNYSPPQARFRTQDPFSGLNHEPITLHRYLYANVDPTNVVDPSGEFGLVEFGTANTVRAELSSLQADVGLSLLESSLGGGTPSDAGGASGWAVIASLAPGALKVLSKKIVSKFIGDGKVAYPSFRRRPDRKEIDAAEFLAEREGARIYIRGGGSEKGADFFLNGRRWELKSLEAPTNSAVAGGIRRAIRQNQSKSVVIDGRKAGLTREVALSGVARAERNGHVATQLKILLGDGSILNLP